MSELSEDTSSKMSERSFLIVCQMARFSAVWILLGVLFPWVRVSGIRVFILGFLAIVAVAVYKSSERLWALVLAAISSLAILATAIIDMASLHRLAGDWPEPREASVHFGRYPVVFTP